MKCVYRLWFLSSIVCLTAAAGFAQTAPASHTKTAASTDKAEIRQVLDEWVKAFEARDVKAIMALYDPDVVAYDLVPPLQYVGKDAYGKDYAEFFAEFKGPLKVEIRDVHIEASGDLAYVACLERVSGTMTNGQQSSTWLRATSVFRKEGGKWLDVHDHVSVPADFATGKAMLGLNP
jgi:uncharacterized protein (TIGR02246 family)